MATPSPPHRAPSSVWFYNHFLRNKTGGRRWITDVKASAMSTFMTPSGTYRHAHAAQGPFFHPKDAMRHNLDISGLRETLVLDNSEGFTQAGVERLYDLIRTYVWDVLGEQAQTRSNILKTGTGFDAQKQFLANIEDAIASPVDIPSSISRYQKTLQYVSTPLDFVFGIGLYLSPSDKALHPGNIQGVQQ